MSISACRAFSSGHIDAFVVCGDRVATPPPPNAQRCVKSCLLRNWQSTLQLYLVLLREVSTKGSIPNSRGHVASAHQDRSRRENHRRLCKGELMKFVEQTIFSPGTCDRNVSYNINLGVCISDTHRLSPSHCFDLNLERCVDVSPRTMMLLAIQDVPTTLPVCTMILLNSCYMYSYSHSFIPRSISDCTY